MEIAIAIIIIGLVCYWAYTNSNKEKYDGSHPLDQFTKPTETAPYKVPEPSAEVKLIAEMSDAIHDTDKPVIAPAKKPAGKRAPAVKKAVAPRAPAKPRAKKAPKQ